MRRRPDDEPLEAARGRHSHEGDVLDDGARWPVAEELFDPVEGVGRAFRHRTHGAIVLVGDPAREAEPSRLAHHVIPKADPLDAAADDCLEPDQIVHSGGPIDARPGQQQDVERKFRTDVGLDQLCHPVQAGEERTELVNGQAGRGP